MSLPDPAGRFKRPYHPPTSRTHTLVLRRVQNGHGVLFEHKVFTNRTRTRVFYQECFLFSVPGSHVNPDGFTRTLRNWAQTSSSRIGDTWVRAVEALGGVTACAS